MFSKNFIGTFLRKSSHSVNILSYSLLLKVNFNILLVFNFSLIHKKVHDFQKYKINCSLFCVAHKMVQGRRENGRAPVKIVRFLHTLSIPGPIIQLFWAPIQSWAPVKITGSPPLSTALKWSIHISQKLFNFLN